MRGTLPRVLPLLHTLVEERVGERRFLTLSSGLSLASRGAGLFLLLGY
jgi:hypothetical protein